MGVQNEEIVAKFGADTSTIDKALRGLDGKIKSFGDGIKDMFKELAAPLSVAGIFVGIEKVMSRAKDIKRVSEDIGVSTHFVQQIQNVGSMSGMANEQVEKLLNSFVRHLPVGSDVEKEFYRVANAIHSTEDSVTRARIAQDAFGKSGVDMIAVLAQGADKIKEIGSHFSEMSDMEIKNLEKAEAQIKQWGNTTLVWLSRVLIGVKEVMANGGLFADARAAGAAMAQRDIAEARAQKNAQQVTNQDAKSKSEFAQFAKNLAKQDKLNTLVNPGDLKDQIDAAQRSMETLRGFLTMETDENKKGDILDQMIEMQKHLNELTKEYLALSQKHTEELQKVRDLERRITEEKEKQIDRYKPTLAELSKMGGPNGDKARQIENLTGQAKAAFGRGDTAAGEAIVRQIEGGDVPGRKLNPWEQRVKDRADAFARKTGTVSALADWGPKHIRGLREDLEASGAIAKDPQTMAIEKLNADLAKTLTETGIKVSDIPNGQ